jgi:HEAT repeat protein
MQKSPCYIILMTLLIVGNPAFGSDIDKRIKGLKSDDVMVRLSSVNALKEIGPKNPKVVPALRAIVRDESELVRMALVSSLEEFGDFARPLLEDLLLDKSKVIRLIAIRALKVLKSEKSIPVLIGVLGHKDKAIRGYAAQTLGKIGSKKAVPALIDLLNNGLETDRICACQALADIGKDASSAIPIILKALKEDSKRIRIEALRVLNKIGPVAKQAIPILLVMMKSKDVDIHCKAIDVLGRIGPEAKSAVPLLIEVIRAKKRGLRHALRTLGFIGPNARAAVPVLIELVKQNKSMKDTVIEALGDIRSEQAIPVLTDILHKGKSDIYYRESAFTALIKIGSKNDKTLIEVLKRKSINIFLRSALKASGDFAVRFLLIAVKSPNLLVRERATMGLGLFQSQAEVCVPVLQALLADTEKAVQLEAIKSLGSIGSQAKPAVSALLKLLPGSSKIRTTALLESFGNIGPSAMAAFPVLVKIVTSESRNSKTEAIEALCKIAPNQAITVLSKVLVLKTSKENKKLSIQKLVQIGPESQKVLLTEFKGDLSVSLFAKSLSELGKGSIPFLLKTIADSSPRPRKVAVKTFLILGSKAEAAVPALEKLRKNSTGEIRRDVSDALYNIARKRRS